MKLRTYLPVTEISSKCLSDKHFWSRPLPFHFKMPFASMAIAINPRSLKARKVFVSKFATVKLNSAINLPSAFHCVIDASTLFYIL